MTPQPWDGLRFQNDHAAHEVVPEISLGGSLPSSDAIGANIECARSLEALELGHHEANGDVLVGPKPRKGTRKRHRDKNWTDPETSVLVKCKRLAFENRASPFRKQKSSAADWEAISKELRNKCATGASEKQCRLRWDTLVRYYRIIKERCKQKDYAELTEEEISGLKLAKPLKKEWYEVIDAICKTRSQKRENPPRGVGDVANHEGGIGNGAHPVRPRITATHQGPLSSAASVGMFQPRSPPLHLPTGGP